MRDNKLKVCPFCEQSISIGICDDEGNIRNREYINDPWSGLGYFIKHEYNEDVFCPIATFIGEKIGCFHYDTEEEAISVWNKRIKSGIR